MAETREPVISLQNFVVESSWKDWKGSISTKDLSIWFSVWYWEVLSYQAGEQQIGWVPEKD